MGARILVLVAGLFLMATFARAETAPAALVDRAISIQDALAHDKLDGVKDNANAIAVEATKLGAPAAKLATAAKSLENAKTLKIARDEFGKMSEELVAYLDAQKMSPAPGVRVAYCPMVNKPWLQKDGPIQNPYFGSEMLTCGAFKK